MRALASAGLVAILSGSCTEPQHGYVEVRLLPLANLQAYPILLEDRPLAAAKGGSIVVRHKVGPVRVAFDRRPDERVPICTVTIRKDRVSTVTIGPATGGLRCTVEPG